MFPLRIRIVFVIRHYMAFYVQRYRSYMALFSDIKTIFERGLMGHFSPKLRVNERSFRLLTALKHLPVMMTMPFFWSQNSSKWEKSLKTLKYPCQLMSSSNYKTLRMEQFCFQEKTNPILLPFRCRIIY